MYHSASLALDSPELSHFILPRRLLLIPILKTRDHAFDRPAPKADSLAMQRAEEIKLARQILFEAEAALDIQVHCAEYDHQRCAELAKNVRIARDEFLDQLSKFWPEN
jgi:hypothetical protein